jgi:hypothetical protein
MWCFAWKHFSMHPPTYAELLGWERKGYLLSENLGKAMRQLPVPDASCDFQVLQVRALTLRDAFHGLHGHGLHTLPITVLGEHVGLEVGDEGLEVSIHLVVVLPHMQHCQHMQTKMSRSHFKKSNVHNCNAKRPKHRIAGDSTLLNCQTRRTEATNCR